MADIVLTGVGGADVGGADVGWTCCSFSPAASAANILA